MGLVLDSSVLIAAERDAKSVGDVLTTLEQQHGQTEIVLSSITVVELEHGFHRAGSAEIARKRRDYLDAVFAAIPVEPFTKDMGQVAAKLDAEAKKTGQVIPFPDLLIGSTALLFDYGVGTPNIRHFQMIQGLSVVKID
jgi:predicted nucleic acid-binding protein